MIKSKFVSDIIELLLDSETKNLEALRNQVRFLVDSDYNYTSVGLLFHFHTKVKFISLNTITIMRYLPESN